MYGNVDADILWLIPIAKYLTNECNITIIKVDYWIFYKKGGDGKSELVVSVRIEDVFMLGRSETLDKIK